MARILLADDDVTSRDLVVRALEMDTHQVEAVSNGTDALARLAQGAEPFDLLISDVQMPGLDGIELARKVAASLPDLPILLMSGYVVEEDAMKSTGAKIAGLISKPFTLEEIRSQVTKLLSAS
jgi:two-component system cell cycle response regulator CpdR